MSASALLAVVAFFKLWALPAEERALRDVVFPMIRIGHFNVDMAFLLDPLSALVTLIITIVGTLIPAHLEENVRIAGKGPLPAEVYAEAKRRLDAAGETSAA